MNIYVCLLVMNQKEVTQECLTALKSRQNNKKIPVLIIDNGSTPPVREWLVGLEDGDMVVRNEENRGVLPAMNQAFEVLKNTDTDYIAYFHNDMIMYEEGWSDKLDAVLTGLSDCGVAGFYGAKGIGTNDIYKTPYRMHQLVRVENVCSSPHMDAGVHGFRPVRGNHEHVAVLDGFSLIVRMDLLKKINGFDRSTGVHHMYDANICLDSIDNGYHNYVIAMDVYHMGGRTDVGENWAEPMGKTKQQVHEEAHPPFYDKWRPGKHSISLPIRVI